MSERTGEPVEQPGQGSEPVASPRARAELRLIALVFLLPLLLMCVTSIVCIAVIFARQ